MDFQNKGKSTTLGDPKSKAANFVNAPVKRAHAGVAMSQKGIGKPQPSNKQ